MWKTLFVVLQALMVVRVLGASLDRRELQLAKDCETQAALVCLFKQGDQAEYDLCVSDYVETCTQVVVTVEDIEETIAA